MLVRYLTENGLRDLRNIAIQIHGPWKMEIALADLVASDKWSILWPDDTVESSEPLIENVYLQALEDKTMTAGAIPPMLFTPPTRGTRRDEGEKNAEKRKRAGLSYWDRSDLSRNLKRFYRDLLHGGIAAAVPWANGFSRPYLPSNERFPFFQLVNIRQIFPLAWDNRGRLTAGLVMRQKRIKELRADWGDGNAAIEDAVSRHKRSGTSLEWLEEIWYFDEEQWAVALGDAVLTTEQQGMPVGPADLAGSMIISWVVPPEPHLLNSCPLKAVSRVTHNDQTRGALMDIVPQLKVAQNFMARLLDDLNSSIYAPVVLDNIKNAHEYGLGAVLVGTGTGQAKIDRDRPPVNFEAQQTVREIMTEVRRQAMEPQQRSGEAGASIVSAKGTNSLMGTFNAELANLQHEVETLLSDATSVTACFDEVWCGGKKEMWGIDDKSAYFAETYDPVTLFKGDYRFKATYGDRTGLDDQQHLIRMSTIKNLDGMSTRTFMEKLGITEDPLHEETEMAIERLVRIFTDVLLPQQIQAGDTLALQKFIDKIDSDEKTVREAVYETIREMNAVAPAQGAGGPGLGAGGRADILKMVRSMGSGGVPGTAEGQPMPEGPAGTPVVGGELRRALSQISPGGTAT